MRYYYTDALQAAWMAREFGMRFLDYTGCEFDILGKDFFPYDTGTKHFIHPDSLHILEPQVGDLVKVCTGVEESEYENFYWIYEGKSSAWVQEIIQRNGRAFFMPEAQDE